MYINKCGLTLAHNKNLPIIQAIKEQGTLSLSTIVLHGPIVDVTPL